MELSINRLTRPVMYTMLDLFLSRMSYQITYYTTVHAVYQCS